MSTVSRTMRATCQASSVFLAFLVVLGVGGGDAARFFLREGGGGGGGGAGSGGGVDVYSPQSVESAILSRMVS